MAKAPDSARAPEALLAIANSQAEMKDKVAARKTLDELIKAYPKSEAAVSRQGTPGVAEVAAPRGASTASLWHACRNPTCPA